MSSGTSALSVSSLPVGAMVLLDSKLVGTTPLSLDSLGSGTYTLTVAARGYAVLDTVVTLVPEQPLALAVTLQEPLSALTRALEAPAFSDGEPPPAPLASTPQAPPQAPPRTRPVPQPPPQASVERPASPAPAEAGTLSVVVRPWGTILIDDAVHARETDIRYEARVPAGQHRVRAVHPVLGSREVTVTVRPGTPARVEIDLNE